VELGSIIGDFYEAAANDGDWLSVGKALFSCLGADDGTLRVHGVDGRSANVFQLSKPGEDRYTNHYLKLDPIRAALAAISPRPDGRSAVFVIDDLLDGDVYHRSEFYQDFAKPNGQEHMLLGAVGDRDQTTIGFFREHKPFGTKERRTLSLLLPHFKRGLQLRERLHRSEFDARIGYTAFEALAGSAIVVDAECNVLFANTSASRCLSRRGLPISLALLLSSGATRLLVNNSSEGARLRSIVRNAAHGESGGAIRLEFDALDNDRIGQFAIFISPFPQQLPGNEALGAGGAPVLILINELSQARAAPPSLFSDLFGLSAAEGAVAAALLGGQTAETVARDREVSLDTVRTQIRTILRKTDAANLRDFERIGALLGTMAR
jgi:DNA-binding NarL/FixJ family response regulator